MKKVRGVIYDCDGVLFESRQANLAYYNAVLAHFGAEPVLADDRERAQLCHTAASPRVFEVLLGPEQVAAAMDVAGRLSYRQFIPWMTPEPDLAETLGRLAGCLPLAVATNRGGSMAEILLHFSLVEYFQVVVTSRDVQRPKPHPDMLLLAAERLALAPGEVLFVGDSELDREAAQGAGMPFIAYKGDGEESPAVAGHRELAERVLGEGEKGLFAF
jgi:HAD superfamily hydrolase (TIGR01509 family)